MPRDTIDALQHQYCPRCGLYFIRPRTKAAKAVLCGYCVHDQTLSLPNLTEAAAEYAENGLFMWKVHQEALQQIPGAPTREQTERRILGDAELADDLPF